MSSSEAITISADDKAEGLDLLKSALVIARHKRLVAGIAGAVTALSLATAFLLPSQYTAQALVVPPSQKSADALAALGQLSSMVGLSGDASQGQADLCAGILKSRVVSDAIIARYQLKAAYRARTDADARKRLADRTDVGIGKSGILSIAVTDTDPGRAAAIANSYVTELNRGMVRIQAGDAAEHRAFFEKETDDARKMLASADAALRAVQQRTGVIEIGAQAQQALAEETNLRAQISVREAQANAMAAFMTPGNGELVRARQEVVSLRAELGKLNAGGSDGVVGLEQLPQKSMDYFAAYREARYRESLYEFTLKQLESARMDEARSTDAVQVVDAAVAPDKRSSPQRSLIVGLGVIAGLMLGILTAFLLEALLRCFRDLERRPLIDRIREELRA